MGYIILSLRSPSWSHSICRYVLASWALRLFNALSQESKVVGRSSIWIRPARPLECSVGVTFFVSLLYYGFPWIGYPLFVAWGGVRSNPLFACDILPLSIIWRRPISRKFVAGGCAMRVPKGRKYEGGKIILRSPVIEIRQYNTD